MKVKGGLGKGLGVLLSQRDICDAGSPGFFLCPIEKIRPNPRQPRRRVDRDSLAVLARSIGEKGVLQPLVVREIENGYELIAGERRWRAAQLAGLRTVPVVIKDVSPDEVLELALIENIQRQDLNPLEEAFAYRRLVDELGMTQAQVSAKVGRDRSTVANFLRLLHLPGHVQEDILDGRLTPGHARALLMVDDPVRQEELRGQILARALSVRQAEALAGRLSRPASPPGGGRREDPDLRRLCEDLSISVGTKVKIVPRKKGGRLEIHYDSPEDLDRIVSRLQVQGREGL